MRMTSLEIMRKRFKTPWRAFGFGGSSSETIIVMMILALIVPAASSQADIAKGFRIGPQGEHAAALPRPVVVTSDHYDYISGMGEMRPQTLLLPGGAAWTGAQVTSRRGSRGEASSSGNGGRRQMAGGLGTGAVVGIVVGGFFGVVGAAAAVYVLGGWSGRGQAPGTNSIGKGGGRGAAGVVTDVSGAIMYVEGVDVQGNLVLTPAFGSDSVNVSASTPYNDRYILKGGGVTTEEQNTALEQRMAARGHTPRKEYQHNQSDHLHHVEAVPLFSHASSASPRPSSSGSPPPVYYSDQHSPRFEPRPRKPTPPWRGPPQRQGWEIPSPSPQPQQIPSRQQSRPQTPRLMHPQSPRQQFVLLASPRSPHSTPVPTPPPRRTPPRQTHQQEQETLPNQARPRRSDRGTPRKSSGVLPPLQMQRVVTASKAHVSELYDAPLRLGEHVRDARGAWGACVRTPSDLYKTMDEGGEGTQGVGGGGGGRRAREDVGPTRAVAERRLRGGLQHRNTIAYNIQRRGKQYMPVMTRLAELQFDGNDNRGNSGEAMDGGAISVGVGAEEKQQVGEGLASSHVSTPSAAQNDQGRKDDAAAAQTEAGPRTSLDERIDDRATFLDQSMSSVKDEGMETYRGRTSPMQVMTGAVHDAMWRDGDSVEGTPAGYTRARAGGVPLLGEGARGQQSGSAGMGLNGPRSSYASDLGGGVGFGVGGHLVSAAKQQQQQQQQQPSVGVGKVRRFLGGEMTAAARGGGVDAASGPGSGTSIKEKVESVGKS